MELSKLLIPLGEISNLCPYVEKARTQFYWEQMVSEECTDSKHRKNCKLRKKHYCPFAKPEDDYVYDPFREWTLR